MKRLQFSLNMYNGRFQHSLPKSYNPEETNDMLCSYALIYPKNLQYLKISLKQHGKRKQSKILNNYPAHLISRIINQYHVNSNSNKIYLQYQSLTY